MSEMNPPPLDGDVRGLVRRAASIELAPAAVKARVFARVEAVIGPDGGGTPTSSGAGGSARTSRSAARNVLGRLLPLGTFVLGGVVGASVMRAAIPAPGSIQPPTLAESEKPAATSVSGVSPASAIAVDDLPVAPESTPHRSVPSTQPIGAHDDLAAERALLDVARSALGREDGAAALVATDQHEHKFPNGILIQEREAIAVRALALIGRVDDARARAERFRSSFPNSVLLPTIESAVDTPRP